LRSARLKRLSAASSSCQVWVMDAIVRPILPR
jgi:hypothetical protein